MILNMETSTLFEDSFVDTFDVLSSSGSSIQVGWKLKAANIPLVRQFQVHYQKVASQYIQYGPLLHANEREYEVEHLVADTYYKICLVVYRSNTTDYRECTDASTTNWQLPVSVGSSIGAMLALSVIVLIVLLSRCKVPLRYRGKKSKSSTRYDTIPSMYRDDQQFECSETVTHGNDDDFVSEFDDEAFYEVPLHDHTRSMRTVNPDKSAIQNGQCRCHVHPHGQANSQHRNSLGRINCSQPHHHTRQFRAYSIQANGSVCFFNQPCSPLAKDPKIPPLMRQDSKQDKISPPQDISIRPIHLSHVQCRLKNIQQHGQILPACQNKRLAHHPLRLLHSSTRFQKFFHRKHLQSPTCLLRYQQLHQAEL
ncbi:uncharacterized protein LOC128225122 [Mya arenaria]|uniref:uncharacterized protein LOC128225122 n=1 Tax=Mya arenaria TaxID=6604 RepID=UPI0022E143E2|nr:uncharacterized protein LOC128225122 [Mya arenaria]